MESLPKVKQEFIAFDGGLNLESPHIQIKKGQVTTCYNFMPSLMGGYEKIKGYERFDGRTEPSSQGYYTLKLADTSGVTVGDTVTGGTSSAQGKVIAKDDTTNTLGIALLSGNFSLAESAGGSTVTESEVLDGVDDYETSYAWELLAQNYWRGLITTVPGSGDILGVHYYNGNGYAFRYDGTSQVKMYKSSTSGWTEVTFFRVLFWDTGILADGDVVVGDTLTGATSGATATVKNIVKNAGTYGADASGYLILDVTSGAFQDNENVQKSAVTVFDADGVDAAITFANNGRFSFINYNFFGLSTGFRMYGADGVNPAFEFDGTVLTPIYLPTVTGAPETNTPKHIEAHKGHLFLSFPSGSLQHSVLGEPLVFSGFLGAAEFGMGYEITGIKSLGENALLISTEQQLSVLYGSSVSDWQLQLIAPESGGLDYSISVLGSPFVLSKRGIVRVDSIQEYGNFSSSTVSRLIRPLVDSVLKNKTFIGSSISRNDDYMSFYFSDGYGIRMKYDALFGAQGLPAFSTFQYFDDVTCLASVQSSETEEYILFGSSDGYVYRENKGINFDGEKIEFALRTPFLMLGSNTIRKSFRRVEIDVDASRPVSFRFSTELSYSQAHTGITDPLTFDSAGGGGYWDESNWNEFYWDAGVVDQSIIPIDGTGHNISVLFYGNSEYETNFTLNNITIHYIPRRVNRG